MKYNDQTLFVATAVLVAGGSLVWANRAPVLSTAPTIPQQTTAPRTLTQVNPTVPNTESQVAEKTDRSGTASATDRDNLQQGNQSGPDNSPDPAGAGR